MNLAELSIREAGRMLREGSITSQDLVRDSLNRIAASDGSIHAFVRLEADAALMAAQEADRELHGGVDRGPLHGIPYGLKDIFDARELPTTCGSRVCVDRIAVSDSAVAARMRAAGAILLGKVATFEFAIAVRVRSFLGRWLAIRGTSRDRRVARHPAPRRRSPPVTPAWQSVRARQGRFEDRRPGAARSD